nr:hypothetical protein [Tanacetum cinerariifolium]
MDTKQAQQKALDDALVASANHALKLTPFYKAFEITTDVPEIYMQEFWATNSIHHTSLCFKMNDPSFEKEILYFIRDLGHTGEIKVLFDVNVNHMHQPWRSFAAIINKCLSGKTNSHDSLRLSQAYKTYYAYATGEKSPKPKYVQKKANSKTSPKKKTVQDLKGKQLKATAKVPKLGKKKLPTQGLETLSEITLSEAEQMKIATKRSRIQFYVSHASGSENDGDDFVHPTLSTFNKEERRNEKLDEEEEGSDMRVQTPSHFESTDDEVTQGVNVEEEKPDEENTNEEEVNELYNDVNIILEGRDTEMTNALLTNVQATKVIEDTHVIMTVVTPEAQH